MKASITSLALAFGLAVAAPANDEQTQPAELEPWKGSQEKLGKMLANWDYACGIAHLSDVVSSVECTTELGNPDLKLKSPNGTLNWACGAEDGCSSCMSGRETPKGTWYSCTLGKPQVLYRKTLPEDCFQPDGVTAACKQAFDGCGNAKPDAAEGMSPEKVSEVKNCVATKLQGTKLPSQSSVATPKCKPVPSSIAAVPGPSSEPSSGGQPVSPGVPATPAAEATESDRKGESGGQTKWEACLVAAKSHDAQRMCLEEREAEFCKGKAKDACHKAIIECHGIQRKNGSHYKYNSARDQWADITACVTPRLNGRLTLAGGGDTRSQRMGGGLRTEPKSKTRNSLTYICPLRKMTYDTLLVDIGDVLCTWDPMSVTALNPAFMRSLMHSATWHDLERGQISTTEAYQVLGAEHQISPDLIAASISQARSSLAINWEFIHLLEHLKKVTVTDLRIYAVSNIAAEHFDHVRQQPLPWSIFTDILTSARLGMRKPELRFFQRVVDQVGGDVQRMIFVDDKPENLCAAQSLGIRGVLARKNDFAAVYRVLRNCFSNPSSRAREFLSANAGEHDSVILDKDIRFKDNFSQLLIWELTDDSSIIYLKWPSGVLQTPPEANVERYMEPCAQLDGVKATFVSGASISTCDSFEGNAMKNIQDLGRGDTSSLWNYFCDLHALTGTEFPPDIDTTSLAYLTLPKEHLDRFLIDSVLDKMVENVNDDDIMQVYFTPNRPRVCPIACINVLRLFYRFGRGDDPRIRTTEDWIIRCLQTRACNEGTRHYTTPECLLYLLSLLYSECDEADLRERLQKPLRDALQERLHAPANPLALAMRISACQRMGVEPALVEPDLESFLNLQDEDGGWPAGHFCRLGSTGNVIGNRGLTTALALLILQHTDAGMGKKESS
ncbi:ATP-dependent DNA helicase tlh1 [Purpureocillium lavendulum]|uniref:ATP-dependent DNA helicase tlh1 n=1 Tax=Purpureocillium lavendulum TaxID=1247861 RepID=A0AB34FE85_9HYPO|nr:ATP-dependent DNA helicase tlh1 [Purpureocillium lavendulum]